LGVLDAAFRGRPLVFFAGVEDSLGTGELVTESLSVILKLSPSNSMLSIVSSLTLLTFKTFESFLSIAIKSGIVLPVPATPPPTVVPTTVAPPFSVFFSSPDLHFV